MKSSHQILFSLWWDEAWWDEPWWDEPWWGRLSRVPSGSGGLPIRRTLESPLWKFGCAPTPGGRIANPPQLAKLPHKAPRATFILPPVRPAHIEPRLLPVPQAPERSTRS